MNKVWTNIYTLQRPEIEKKFSIVVGNDLHFHPNLKTEKLNKILNEIAKFSPEYIRVVRKLRICYNYIAEYR